MDSKRKNLEESPTGALKKEDEMRNKTSKLLSILLLKYDYGKGLHCLKLPAIHAAMQKKAFKTSQ